MAGLNDILSEEEPTQTAATAQAEPQHEEQGDPTGEQITASPAVEQEDEVEKHRKGLEAGIAAERTRRQAAEQRAAQLEAQLRQQGQQQQQQPKPAQHQEGPERPKRDQFPTQEAYEDALLGYGDKLREARETQARQQREEKDQETQFWQAVDTMVGRGQTKYPDFDVVVNAGLGKHLASPSQQSHALRFALSQSDKGEDIAYHLGKNAAEADRVAALPPAKMLHAIGVIEAKLSAPEKSDAQDRPAIPQTLTTQRNAQGRFTPAYSGPTPLNDILATKQ